ncbi:MAG: hypothetical protein ACYC2S_09885 [Spirochaetales bacterium]
MTQNVNDTNDSSDKLKNYMLEHIREKSKEHNDKVLKSQEFIQGTKYLRSITKDFINALRSISFYSTSAGDLYHDFFFMRVIDELIESAIAISMLSEQGIYNPLKRELRYLIELSVKSVGVDYLMMGKSIEEKTTFLETSVPNSSIEFIDNYSLPFDESGNDQFRSEIKDFFYKACAYVHPSGKQFKERLERVKKGTYIGFDTAKMLTENNILVFRAFDMILTLMYHGFGESMSGDLFIQFFDNEKLWKFHKGKYVSTYSHLFDYKAERK